MVATWHPMYLPALARAFAVFDVQVAVGDLMIRLSWTFVMTHGVRSDQGLACQLMKLLPWSATPTSW